MSRRKEFFPEVTDQQWNDWHWQVKNRIETVDELKKYIKLTAEEEEGIRESLKTLRMAITPYYLTLIDPENPHCPIRKQAIPTVEELKRSPADLEDPLHEDSDSPVPGLTHRYPDRVLFLITDMCSMYCRHCTRRRFAGQHDCATPEKQIDDCIDYIARTPQVRDVLLSGGDALLVSDEKLEYIISRLRAIPHVEIIRIGSRTPVVLPQRITPELVNMLKKYHPIWLNTHFNHPNEVTPESKQACARLADAGIPLGNQSVLLRGVNDCTHIMKKLVHELVKMRVRPYYNLYLRPVAGHRTLPHSGIERHRNHREPPGTHLGLRRSDIRRGRSGRWWQDSCHAELCHLAGSEPRGTPQLRRCDHDLYGTDRLQGRMPLRRVRESTSEGRRGRVVERRTSFARAVRIEPQDP